MNATHPMNQQNDLASLGVHIGNDLLDQHAHDALLQPRIRGRRRPH
jgi:hypothetical protein